MKSDDSHYERLDIEPWFPNPTKREDVRNQYDGSLISAPVQKRCSLSGVGAFLLFGSMVALFMGLLTSGPHWWTDEPVERGLLERIWIGFGLIGGVIALLWATAICLGTALEAFLRIRTIIVGSTLSPWFLRFAHIALGAAAGALLIVIGIAGLRFWEATYPGVTESGSWSFFLAVIGLGWCFLLTLIFAMLCIVCIIELITTFAVARHPESGPLRTQLLGNGRALIAHWSDLHLTADEGVPAMERRPGLPLNGNAPLRQVIIEHRGVLDHADVILITGDVTDSGNGEEWRAFLQLLPTSWLPRIVIVPGNHDLNIADPYNKFVGEGEDQIDRKLRAVRLIAALDWIQGERTRVLTGSGALVPLRQILSENEGNLQEFIANPPARTYEDSSIGLRETTSARDQQLLELPHYLMRAIFPCVVEVPGTPLRIAVVDSNIESDFYPTCAMGAIPPDHLLKLREILRILDESGEPCVVGLHHHVALPRRAAEGFMDRAQARFMACENAVDLVSALDGSNNRVVLHGHRHVKYEASLAERIHLLSAPSTTLGNEWGPRPAAGTSSAGFATVEVSWGSNGVSVRAIQEFHSVHVLNEPEVEGQN